MRQGCRESYRYSVHLGCIEACVHALDHRQAKMEMETEDDVVMEGNADPPSSSIGLVTDQESQRGITEMAAADSDDSESAAPL